MIYPKVRCGIPKPIIGGYKLYSYLMIWPSIEPSKLSRFKCRGFC